MSKKKIKSYCHPHNKQEWGVTDAEGYFVADCGCKTKVVLLDDQETSILNGFVNADSPSYSFLEAVGKMLSAAGKRN